MGKTQSIPQSNPGPADGRVNTLSQIPQTDSGGVSTQTGTGVGASPSYTTVYGRSVTLSQEAGAADVAFSGASASAGTGVQAQASQITDLGHSVVVTQEAGAKADALAGAHVGLAGASVSAGLGAEVQVGQTVDIGQSIVVTQRAGATSDMLADAHVGPAGVSASVGVGAEARVGQTAVLGQSVTSTQEASVNVDAKSIVQAGLTGISAVADVGAAAQVSTGVTVNPGFNTTLTGTVTAAADASASAHASVGVTGINADAKASASATESVRATTHTIVGNSSTFIDTDSSLTAGQKSEVSATAQFDKNGIKLGTEVASGQFAEAKTSAHAGNENISGGVTAGYIVPGSVGSGQHFESSIKDGYLTIGAGVVGAIGISGLELGGDFTINIKPVVHFVDEVTALLHAAQDTAANFGNTVLNPAVTIVNSVLHPAENAANGVVIVGNSVSKSPFDFFNSFWHAA